MEFLVGQRLTVSGERGLLVAELALDLGDLLAFAGSDGVGFEFGEHSQDVEEVLVDGVGGVVDGTRRGRNRWCA